MFIIILTGMHIGEGGGGRGDRVAAGGRQKHFFFLKMAKIHVGGIRKPRIKKKKKKGLSRSTYAIIPMVVKESHSSYCITVKI